MKVITLPLGFLATNAYILCDENTRKALIIDPGAQADKVLSVLKEENLTLDKIVLTHGHFDHIGGVMALKEATGAEVFIHEAGKLYLEDSNYNLAATFLGQNMTVTAEHYLKDGETVGIEDTAIQLQTIHVPGHTKDGVAFYHEESKKLFVGDILFRGSIGRTDFIGGDIRSLLTHIKDKLLILPEDTTVYPGHGETTTIGYEKDNNPNF